MSDERKPVWDETWSAREHTYYDGVTAVIVEMPGDALNFDTRDIDRARLVSAAPDMARALIALEWSGYDRDQGKCCPSCEALGPDAFWSRASEPHRADCALDAALRKAGVR